MPQCTQGVCFHGDKSAPLFAYIRGLTYLSFIRHSRLRLPNMPLDASSNTLKSDSCALCRLRCWPASEIQIHAPWLMAASTMALIETRVTVCAGYQPTFSILGYFFMSKEKLLSRDP